MNNLKNTIHLLIRSGITGEKLTLPQDIDMDALYRQLRRHSIVSLGYTGLVNCGMDKKHPVMQQLFRDYIAVMMKSEKQQAALDALFEAFEQQEIDYLLLKGINMKKLYPKPELRAMGDADVLIREEQYDEIKKIVEDMGYKQDICVGHTLNWKSDALYLEFHISMVSEANEKFLDYLGNGWDRAIKETHLRYSFSPEDEFIFLFIHLAKHFIYSGVGYRQLTDLWVYKREHPDLDYDFINQEMISLGIKDFYDNAMKTLNTCFENQYPDEKTELITDFVFNSGNWGDMKSTFTMQKVKESTNKHTENKTFKFQNLISTVFPAAKHLVYGYPVLKKHPVLLPFIWVKRWYDVFTKRRKNIKLKLKAVKSVSVDDVQTQKQMFEKIGLDFNF